MKILRVYIQDFLSYVAYSHLYTSSVESESCLSFSLSLALSFPRGSRRRHHICLVLRRLPSALPLSWYYNGTLIFGCCFSGSLTCNRDGICGGRLDFSRFSGGSGNRCYSKRKGHGGRKERGWEAGCRSRSTSKHTRAHHARGIAPDIECGHAEFDHL